MLVWDGADEPNFVNFVNTSFCIQDIVSMLSRYVAPPLLPM